MKLVVKGMAVRSMEVTWLVCLLQVMPVNEHGFWFGSQFGRIYGFGRVALKFRSWLE